MLRSFASLRAGNDLEELGAERILALLRARNRQYLAQQKMARLRQAMGG